MQYWNHVSVHSFRVKIFTAASIQSPVLSFALVADWLFLWGLGMLLLLLTSGAKSALITHMF